MDDQPAMLGDRVREVVTGRTGLVTGFCEYLWGCEQLLVHIDGEKDKDGDTKTVWYDVSRLEVTERAAVAAIEHRVADHGLEPIATEPLLGRRRPWWKRSGLALAFNGPDTPAPIR